MLAFILSAHAGQPLPKIWGVGRFVSPRTFCQTVRHDCSQRAVSGCIRSRHESTQGVRSALVHRRRRGAMALCVLRRRGLPRQSRRRRPLQLVPWIRKHAPSFHRCNGRAFLVAAIVATLFGLYLQWFRDATQGPADTIGNTVASILIVAFAALALRHARTRNFDAHRRWALRQPLTAVGTYGAATLKWLPAILGCDCGRS